MTDSFRLQLTREEMRELGYRVIDRIVDHVDGLPNRPVAKKLGRRELDERLSEPVPEQPMDPDRLFEQLDRDVLGPTMHVDHPRYFAFVPGPSNFVGVLADALASGLNVFAGTWLEASGPAAVELTTIDWLRELIGYPESAGGLFVSGGSIANLTALTVARQEKLGEAAGDGVVYCSRPFQQGRAHHGETILDELANDLRIESIQGRLVVGQSTRALRLCTINPRTTEDDVRQTVQLIETIGSRLSS